MAQMRAEEKMKKDELARRSQEFSLRARAPVHPLTLGIEAGGYAMNLPVAGEAKTEAYAYHRDSDFLGAAENPLSTFSIDVDTASYANVRRMLAAGQRPPVDAVRIEEMLNYFPYRYAAPTGRAPFAATMEVAEAPWAPAHRLVRIGLKGREISDAARPAANLVFLLDVSGSMNMPNKLPLVKESMRLLVARLHPDDRVAIVVYAGASGLVLPSTPVSRANEILAALDQLTADGSTNGAMGIQLAYDVAKANFIPGGVNRVILCTDGDFNVGVTSEGELVRLIGEKAKSGVFLTALGFGMGNYKDATLQQLADKGNGNYGYIDTRREAEKLLVEQVSGTLVTVAKDVKIQVEFNPAQVARYRLIGYEKRVLAKEDFNNDAVDAGEIGAGHTVTALYEVVPVGAADATPVPGAAPAVDELKYRTPARAAATVASDEILTVKVRYKEPAGDVSQKLEFPLVDRGLRMEDATADFKFAAAVAEFGLLLRDSPHKGAASYPQVLSLANAGRDQDPGGYRGEFIDLVRKAETAVR
ncbi:MAG: VWA domain-containing protein [Verrucomicrobia bacterium]|nr:VWA domain-containing protein [Verrucomicrobiota bacterium]